MKKILLIILFLSTIYSGAQIVITPNPVDINSGSITITYGSNNDYSLFDPMNYYLRSFLEPGSYEQP